MYVIKWAIRYIIIVTHDCFPLGEHKKYVQNVCNVFFIFWVEYFIIYDLRSISNIYSMVCDGCLCNKTYLNPQKYFKSDNNSVVYVAIYILLILNPKVGYNNKTIHTEQNTFKTKLTII